ncbi:MAG: hypothetical protein ABW168_10180, partial [Sedimenticola sp.]
MATAGFATELLGTVYPVPLKRIEKRSYKKRCDKLTDNPCNHHLTRRIGALAAMNVAQSQQLPQLMRWVAAERVLPLFFRKGCPHKTS